MLFHALVYKHYMVLNIIFNLLIIKQTLLVHKTKAYMCSSVLPVFYYKAEVSKFQHKFNLYWITL